MGAKAGIAILHTKESEKELMENECSFKDE
jgi:hypothetical protein